MTHKLIEKRVGDFDISCLYKISGDECILFIHGLGCSKDSFIDAFYGEWFTGELSLLAVDLVGHGQSSKPGGFSYELEQQVAVIVDLLKSLDIKTLHIVAHSMGGGIALLAMRSLNQVKSFFSLEGNLVAEDCTLSKRVVSMSESKFVNELYPLAPQKFRCRGLPTDPDPSPVAVYRSAKSLIYWSTEGNLLEEFSRLSFPKYYFYGEYNQNIPVLSRLQSFDTVKIPGCGHFMMLDNPHVTYNEIRNRIHKLRG